MKPEKSNNATIRSVLSEWVRTRRSTPWRKNVLVLVGTGYAVLVAIFFGLIWKGATPQEGYDFIESPLMALIGGSLAIAKDLVTLDKSEHNPKPPKSNDSEG